MIDDTKGNLYYNYYSTKEVINVLSQCDLIKHNPPPNVILSLIANCIGTADWSPTDKSPNIEIGVLDSSHRAMIGGITQCSHHAILTNLETSKYDTILINDWIDTIASIKRGWVYRYSLEFFGPVSHLATTKNLFIGLITSQKLTGEKLQNSKVGHGNNNDIDSSNCNNDKFFANKDSTIGNDFYGHSLGWKLECSEIESKKNGRETTHMFRYKILENINKDRINMDWGIFDGTQKKESETNANANNNKNTNRNANTIDIEINLVTNRFRVGCNAFVDYMHLKQWAVSVKTNSTRVSKVKVNKINIPLIECDIPKRLLKHELPMRIAVMFDHDEFAKQDEFSKCYTKSRYCAVGIKHHISNFSKTIFNKLDCEKTIK